LQVKNDGTSVAGWLSNLSTFSGALFQKYSVNLETQLPCLLHYLTQQLKAGSSVDLIILKELIFSMSGLEGTDDYSPEFLMSQSGGNCLRDEAHIAMALAAEAAIIPGTIQRTPPGNEK
jgi:hypothetical protein